MIREDLYGKLKELKGNTSFSDVLERLVKNDVELRRAQIRGFFGALGDKAVKESQRFLQEVWRVAKGRLF